MKLNILFAIVIVTSICSAQTVEFSYDASGNRIQRKLVVVDPHGRNAMDSSIYSPEEEKLSEQIKIFPNPTSQTLSIAIESLSQDECAIIELFDLSGKSVLKQNQCKDEVQLNLSGLKSGTYYLRLNKSGTELTFQIIKSD